MHTFPTLCNGDAVVAPSGPQVVYRKSGILAHQQVRSFPAGLRLVN